MQSVDRVSNTNTSISTKGKSARKLPDDKTLKKLAQDLGMSVEDLKKSITKSKVPANRKSIYGLADNNKMDMKTFCKLNGIDYSKWRDYKADSNEEFFILQKSTEPTKAVQSKKTQPHLQKTKKPQSQQKTQSQTQQNKIKYGSSFTPEEISGKLYSKSVQHYGAVGKPDFDALIDEINPKNVSQVLKSYVENQENTDKESLINTITSEIKSDPQKRKDAVMHIYDALAKEKETPPSVRESFKKELNDQFDSWGMVSTDKLDETISRMMASPDELAIKMEADIDGKMAAVGKSSFNELLSFVNSKNAEEVIKSYNKLGTGESLIEAITSEVQSSKQSRKDAVMHIYDALAKAKGTPSSTREEFEKELNDQFASWGMVNTKNMDRMIDNIINSNNVDGVSATKQKVKTDKAKTTVTSKSEKSIHVIKNKYEVGVVGKRKVSKTAAKPPIPVDEEGNVIAEVIKFSGAPSGPLKGKTIMVNAGHGWGGRDADNANFAPGARYKDKNGKMLEEWYKNRNFADNLIEELTKNGANVIYTTGNAPQVCKAKKDKDFASDMLISLHCNAVDNNTKANGIKIVYDGVDSKNSDNFAKIMEKQFKTQVNKKTSIMPAKKTAHGYIGLIDEDIKPEGQPKMPALLMELGFMSNPKDKLNIDSYTQRQLMMKNVTIAIMKYYNIDPKEYKQ